MSECNDYASEEEMQRYLGYRTPPTSYNILGQQDPKRYSSNLATAYTIDPGEGSSTVTIKRTSRAMHGFEVDVRLGDVRLPLVLTGVEAYCVLHLAKIRSGIPPSTEQAPFLKLPREIRDRIYEFAIPESYERVDVPDRPFKYRFIPGLADPSGVFFPVGARHGLLEVCRRLREEALPLVYRQTAFLLDDVDHTVRFLMAVGKIGRENIESLQLVWASNKENYFRWPLDPVLPTNHAERCIQLLKQCKRLSKLILYFEQSIVPNMSPEAFKSDPGIRGLCSIGGLREVQLRPRPHGNRPANDVVWKWLHEAMTSSWSPDASK
ncbi:MAG: hypothetical protein Q9222_004418 [Ikaeria aurantiellina]